METYIKISTLNDFIFCPRSIYFHELYEKYDQSNYHEIEQTEWKINHERIDKKDYSTSKDILQWVSIYSDTYNICWKIDLYHRKKKSLLERKTFVKKIYKWYILQVHAQYFCMKEMWYDVQKIKIYSMKDNKVYEIDTPILPDLQYFEEIIEKYHKFVIDSSWFTQNRNKCEKCIYRELCDYYN